MGSYKDDFQPKFKRERDASRTQDELQRSKNEAIASHAIELWDALRKEATNAVEQINSGGEGLLIIAGADIGSPPGFDIIFTQGTKQRKANIVFDEKRHVVKVNVTGPSPYSQTFEIRSNDELKVGFVKEGAAPNLMTNESIVRTILQNLL